MKEQKPFSMSEQKKSPSDSWRSEIIETPKNPKFGRRSALKLGAAAVGGAALIGAGLTAKKVMEDLGIQFQPQEKPDENFFYQEAQKLAKSTQQAPKPTAFQPQSPTKEASTPEPSPTPETYNAWEFANIDLSNSKKPVDMGFFIGNDTVLVPSFKPTAFFEGILESGGFSPDTNTGLTYLDGLNRKILNLHSGRKSILDKIGFTAWQLQKYLEVYPNVEVMRYPREVNDILKNSFIGSQVIIRQAEVSSQVVIKAAVRVAPPDVAESQEHVGDIIDWLGAKYPDSGFANLGKDHEALAIKFCGRILSGEDEDPSRPSYQQSRFFIALKQS